MDWFPDWSGDICVILASGPSARRGQAAKLRGRAVVITVNCAWTLAPWADALYAADPKWWACDEDGYGQHALAEFGGLKVCSNKALCDDNPALNHVTLRPGAALVTEPGVIGDGKNSGFQALNLGVQFGARKVMLLGFDMRGQHFHPEHPLPLGSPDQYTFSRWRAAFNDAAAALREIGAEVVNCTPGSTLNMFPKTDIDEALARFLLARMAHP